MNGPVVGISRVQRQPSKLELHFIVAELGQSLLMNVLNRDWIEGRATGAHLVFDDPNGLATVVHPETQAAGQ